MQIWFRFWRTAFLWAAVLVSLLTLRDLVVQFTGDYSRGMVGLSLVLMRVPRTFGLLLPFTGFVAAVVLASSAGRHPRWKDAGGVAATLVSVGLVVFLLLAYVGPWTEAVVKNSLVPDPAQALPAATRGRLLAQYVEAAAYARANPEPSPDGSSHHWVVAGFLGFQYYMQTAAACLAAVMAALGLLVGWWTRPADGRMPRIAQRWAAGLFLLASVVLAHRVASALTVQHRLDPSLSAYAIVVVPALFLVALAWAFWTLREIPARGEPAWNAGRP